MGSPEECCEVVFTNRELVLLKLNNNEIPTFAVHGVVVLEYNTSCK